MAKASVGSVSKRFKVSTIVTHLLKYLHFKIVWGNKYLERALVLEIKPTTCNLEEE
jgi:hypothetical protein